MRTPTPDQMRQAALWLEQNEGDPAEREPMLAVARWLEAQADAKYLRDTCRAMGVPVRKVLERISGGKTRGD